MEEQTAGNEDSGKHFWKTLPGILTAVSGIVVSCSGLLTGLSAAGFIGKNKPEPVAAAFVAPSPSSPAAAATAAVVAPAPAPATGLSEYRVGQMSDGFAWVRKTPSKQGETMLKLPSGAHVRCGNRLRDTDPASESRWRFCPEHDGYVSARLLISAED